ncbi:hypothetical protein KJ765_03650 [Candidatus Micrarchaeota archaeon]|nr:hypothetical protein [Candidatus Micrarchaeota archaeon]
MLEDMLNNEEWIRASVTHFVKDLWKKGTVITPGGWSVQPLKQVGRGLIAEAAGTFPLFYFDLHANPTDTNRRKEHSFRNRVLAFYPQLEHAYPFASSALEIRTSAPGGFLRGSVGTVQVRDMRMMRASDWLKRLLKPFWKNERSPDYLWVHDLEGSFIKKHASALTRGTASKYWQWREHLLSHVFQDALDRNVNRVVFSIHQKARNVQEQQRVFRSVAKEKGFRVLETAEWTHGPYRLMMTAEKAELKKHRKRS